MPCIISRNTLIEIFACYASPDPHWSILLFLCYDEFNSPIMRTHLLHFRVVILCTVVTLLVGVFGFVVWKNLVMLSILVSKDTPKAFSACAEVGGNMTWISEGILMPNPTRRLQCVEAYLDAGEECTDGTQCRGECIAIDQNTPRGGSVNGRCEQTNGDRACVTTVTNGKSNGEDESCDLI